jgi:hypothetical protein
VLGSNYPKNSDRDGQSFNCLTSNRSVALPIDSREADQPLYAIRSIIAASESLFESVATPVAEYTSISMLVKRSKAEPMPTVLDPITKTQGTACARSQCPASQA